MTPAPVRLDRCFRETVLAFLGCETIPKTCLTVLERVQFNHNPFRALQPAVVIRGVPEETCDVHHYWFLRHMQPERAARAAVKTPVHDHACRAEPDVVP